MTLNVINYFRELEEKRSNQAQEALRAQELAESQRHNIATEAETNRHNVISENEVQRHNLETEELGRNTLAETHRHNLVTENVAWATVTETSRHNKEIERETRTHNRAQEKYWTEDLRLKDEHYTDMYNAEMFGTVLGHSVDTQRQEETERHNQSMEGLTKREQNINAVVQGARTAAEVAKAVALGFSKKGSSSTNTSSVLKYHNGRLLNGTE